MAEKKIICDTDVIIDYWNENSQRHLFTKNILENIVGLNKVILTAVTQMELIAGAHNKEDLARINKNIHQFRITLIDNNITQYAIQLLQTYKLSHGLGMPDSLIAATALTLDVELFTHNLKDYKFIDKLKLFDQIRS